MNTVQDMFNTDSYRAMKTAMRANTLRQKVIASNVANINTPGYRTKDLSFEKIHQEMNESGMGLRMRLTHPNHMRGMPGESVFDQAIFDAYQTSYPSGSINDVDIDREMVKNNETAMNIKIFGELLKRRYAGLKDVIDKTP